MAEITIGNDLFTVNPLLGEESFIFQPRIMPLVADLVSLFTLGAGDAPEEAKDPDVVEQLAAEATGAPLPEPPAPKKERDLGALLAEAAPIVQRACARMPPEELRIIMRTLLQGATMNGQPLYRGKETPINILLRGRTIDIWKLIIFALQVSYPDFFGLLRGSQKRSAEAPPSEKSTT